MRKQIFFLSVGLILLAICSCDKSVQNDTETDAAMAKVKRRATAMYQPSELGNFFVNPDLDDEFQLSEAEIVEELMSWGFLEYDDPVEITPIYQENIIPAFFKSLIVEPESNEWYGINVDEVMNTYREFPSIAFYVINSESGKSFLTTADRRFPCNLIDYRSEYLDPDIITVQEDIIHDLYESCETLSFAEFDSITLAFFRERFGASISDDRFELKVCCWKFQAYRPDFEHWYDCRPIGVVESLSLLPIDMRWGQSKIFGDCDHNQKIGSIVVSILKLLCFSNYSGLLLDEYFDGSIASYNIEELNYFAWKLYHYIEDVNCFPTLTGIRILANCGFQLYDTGEVHMQDVRSQIDAEKLVLAEDRNGNWLLICGYKKKRTTCDSWYIYDYDYNKCEPYTNSWYYGIKYKMYYY